MSIELPPPTASANISDPTHTPAALFREYIFMVVINTSVGPVIGRTPCSMEISYGKRRGDIGCNEADELSSATAC